MATMSMNKIIHAAVRRDVTRTEQALRALPDGDRDRARQVQRAWQHLVKELTHHQAEDRLAWPFLLSRGVDPELMAAMESEHGAMKDALSRATRAVIDGHLEHEERDVEPLIEHYEDEPEWKAAAKEMRPDRITDAADALAWMRTARGSRNGPRSAPTSRGRCSRR